MAESKPHQTVRLRCECGEDVDVMPSAKKIECSCGAVYALTVTQLDAPGDQ